MKKFKSTLLAVCMVMTFVATAMAASQVLNGGGATWSGGENVDGILYSQLVDNAADGIRYSVTVWVESDDGVRKELSGTTSGVGSTGKVYVSKASTHNNPFVTEKAGYKNFVAIR